MSGNISAASDRAEMARRLKAWATTYPLIESLLAEAEADYAARTGRSASRRNPDALLFVYGYVVDEGDVRGWFCS